MCAHGPVAAGTSSPHQEREGESASVPPSAVGQALAEVGRALAGRKVELICTAYLALRRSGRGTNLKELLTCVERVHGPKALAMIISAFSHRRCLMCEEGVAACQTCDGTGTVDRFSCPSCDGLGILPCTFCLGAGWSSPDEIPDEFSKGVLRRRVSHLAKSIRRLAKLPGPDKLAAPGALPLEKRKQLVAWLVRLQARLNSLAAAPVETWGDHTSRYGELAGRIDGILEAIRPKHHDPLDEDDEELL